MGGGVWNIDIRGLHLGILFFFEGWFYTFLNWHHGQGTATVTSGMEWSIDAIEYNISEENLRYNYVLEQFPRKLNKKWFIKI